MTKLTSIWIKKRHVVKRAVDGKTSNWLSMIPIASHHFDLSAMEFRDALAMHYGRPLLQIQLLVMGVGLLSILDIPLIARRRV